jgi:RNA polymerase sigma-B factor
VKAGDTAARQALIERYVPLARSLAFRYSRSGEPSDDLAQVASLGLVKAVDRWEPGLGHAFSSYAVPTILGELRRYFRDATWIVRPPRALLELSLEVERMRAPLGAALGREPSVADLADRLGRPVSEVDEAIEAFSSRVARSLDLPVTEGEHETTIVDLLGDEDGGYEQAEARTVIEGLMAALDERGRTIVHLRYQHDLLQSDIASLVGLSQMHVSRLLSVSLERLSAYASGLELRFQPA